MTELADIDVMLQVRIIIPLCCITFLNCYVRFDEDPSVLDDLYLGHRGQAVLKGTHMMYFIT